jgi:hypothetical protein
MTLPNEIDGAIVLANRVLDGIGVDPDGDLALLARQFLRALEHSSWLPIETLPTREGMECDALRIWIATPMGSKTFMYQGDPSELKKHVPTVTYWAHYMPIPTMGGRVFDPRHSNERAD